jgi:DNA primase
MGLVRGNQNIFHCFGCGIKGDIFLAAHLLENKPLTGKGFVVENLKYLANQFGVEVEDYQLTEEEIYEMEVKHACAHASGILTSSVVNDLVRARVADMGWRPETLHDLGIGSVASFDDYMERMTQQYGYDQRFLESIDLANRGIFNSNNLVFTVCDEAGAPIGFASRSLTYEADRVKYEATVADIEEHNHDVGRAEAAIRSQVKPLKYVNTSVRNKFYQKIRRLFGFQLAKKFCPPLFVMEGYPDAATAIDRGLRNTCAIGSTAFTREHVDVILNCGIKHIIIVLDGDNAGYEGTDRAVKIIEEAVGERVGLKVELIQMPEGSDDPDRFIRLYGVDEFLKLPRYDIFSWKVKREIEAGHDPIILANEAVPLIVNDPNYLNRLAKIKKLSQATGVDEEFLRLEVKRRVDQDVIRIGEERKLVVTRMVSDMKKSPDAVAEIVRQGLSQIEAIEKRKDGYEPKNVLAAITYVFDRQENHVTDVGIATGWPIWDKQLGGLPDGAGFISCPGKPNQGKTSVCSNLAHRIPDLNDNAITMFHSVDDSLEKAIPRILGSKYQLPSKLWQKSGFYLKGDGRPIIAEKYPDFPQIYYESQKWLQQMISDEKLVLADINLLPGSLPALESWLKIIRQRFPNERIVCMGDNFALYQLEVESDSEAVRARRKSMFVKRLANEYQACLFMTCELTKESLKPGMRPRMGNIKDTQGVAYDADANLGVYNDLKDRGDSADLVWGDPNELVRVSVEGVEQMAPRRKPVLELVCDKNKLSDYDGCIYYEFDQVTAEMRECSESEQAIFRARAEKITSRTIAAQIGNSSAPYRQQF